MKIARLLKRVAPVLGNRFSHKLNLAHRHHTEISQIAQGKRNPWATKIEDQKHLIKLAKYNLLKCTIPLEIKQGNLPRCGTSLGQGLGARA